MVLHSFTAFHILQLLLLLTHTISFTSPYTTAPGAKECATCTGGNLGKRDLSSVIRPPAQPGGQPVVDPVTMTMTSPDNVLRPPGEGTSGLPLPFAVDHTLVLNKNHDKIIPLRSRLELADLGETSFPINVPDDFVVADVKLTVRGFFHEHAGDMIIKLKHNVDRIGMSSLFHNQTARPNETASLENRMSNTATLVSERLGPMTFGHPRAHPFPNIPGNGYPTANRVRGDGLNYIIHDLHAKNLAHQKPTNQSSTSYGGVSARAVDGVTNGHYSSLSVTHTAGHGVSTDPQAWWQVDLTAAQTIGTIGVWNRIQESNIDEIQAITADAAETMSGTFTLTFNFSGLAYESAPIRHDAPATIAEEVLLGSTYVGESMQAKLQGLDNIGTVTVRREVFDSMNGGYTWFVTFLSEPGNLQEMTYDTVGLTAQGSSVSVQTIRHGNSNVWYNYKHGLSSIRGRLYPSWLMVLPEDPSGNSWSNLTCMEIDPDNVRSSCPLTGQETLDRAKKVSVWSVRIVEDARETSFRLPANVVGRYVRIQLESAEDYLSLAEVQVYSERTHKFRDYSGGSPISNAATYQPEESLNGNFAGMQARGTWMLGFRDVAARTTTMTSDGRDRYDSHGRGAIDDWVLVLTDVFGVARTYHMDISAVVKTLPIYGKLYIYDTKYEARGRPIEFIKGMQRNNAYCSGDCDENDNYGQGTDLSGTISGSLAAWNVVIKDRQVVYSPARDYLGEDFFSYTTFMGVTESTNTGVVTLDVRQCRQNNCLNDAFGDHLGNLDELWYRAEETPVTPFVPLTSDLLDVSDLINDPWVQQPTVGVQGGPCGMVSVMEDDGLWYHRRVLFVL